jgi:hypothetical protein
MSEALELYTLRIPPRAKELINQEARKRGVTASSIIRSALAQYLEPSIYDLRNAGHSRAKSLVRQ